MSKIKIYDDEQLFRKAIIEEKRFREWAEHLGGNYLKSKYAEFAMFVPPKNYKKKENSNSITDTEIHKYKDIYPEINDYNKLLEHLINKKYKLTRIPEEELLHLPEDERIKNSFRILGEDEAKLKKSLERQIALIKIDMKDCLKSKLRTVNWKAPLPDTGKTDWDELDMMDKSHVKELLRVQRGNDLSDDLSCIIMDLENLIRNIQFTDIQDEVLGLWRRDKTQDDIANILNITQPAVNKNIDKIVDKIIDQYIKEYEDWYYLNICKGEYKTCSKCKKAKLVRNFHKNGGNRLRPRCKDCS